MTEPDYRVAPPGFTPEQWEEFLDRGMLVFRNALSQDEVDRYVEAIDRVCASDPNYRPGRDFRVTNAVTADPVLSELIDHPRHVGYGYDLYGELLKVQRSDVFVRPRNTNRSTWHPDSPRPTPYATFSPVLPLRLCIGYWLTDLPRTGMANFIYLPGSHKSPEFEPYYTHRSVPGEEALCVPAGTITVMHCGTWHRVDVNETDTVRKNIFISYCPSWLWEGDRRQCDPEWIATLNREQRIIMRSFPEAHDRTNPRAEDIPLFLSRETRTDSDPDADPKIPLRIRRRRTMPEKMGFRNELEPGSPPSGEGRTAPAVSRNIQPAFPVDLPLNQVPEKFRELIGLDHIPERVDFTLGEAGDEEQEEGLRESRITFSNYLGEAISARFIRPREPSGPLAGLVCMNGTGSTADHVAHERYHRPRPDEGPLFGWGRELARRGYAMLTFTPKGAETRRITLGRWEEENRRLIPYGRSQIGVIADEVLRAARVLGAQEGVDANRVGLAGMSLGGWATWLGMALGDWIRAGASVCGGLGSLRINIHDGMPERHSSFAYLPHMLRYFEHWDIVNSCIAPRPFMMLAPTEDEDMPKTGVDRLIREVAPVYAAAGKPDHFKVVQPPGRHVFRLEYFELVCQWFDRFLETSDIR